MHISRNSGKCISVRMVIAMANTSQEKGTERVKRLLFAGEVDTCSVARTIRDIIEINEDKSADLIELYLATHGGSIDAGLGLYDIIKMSPIPVDTIVTGCAMSMGSTLLQAGRRRYATPNSRIMIHPGTGGGSGRFAEAKQQVAAGIRIGHKNNQLVADRVGMSLSDYVNFMGDAKYMSPKKALKHNFIDGIKETW